MSHQTSLPTVADRVLAILYDSRMGTAYICASLYVTYMHACRWVWGEAGRVMLELQGCKTLPRMLVRPTPHLLYFLAHSYMSLPYKKK